MIQDLHLNSCTEQLTFLSHQLIVVTIEDPVLRTELTGLETHEVDAPKCVLFFKPINYLGQIRPHLRDENPRSVSRSTSFFQTKRPKSEVDLEVDLLFSSGKTKIRGGP
jgi:hypothetical protein